MGGRLFLISLVMLVLMLVLSALVLGTARALPSGGELIYTSYQGLNADIFRLDVRHRLRINLTEHDGYDAASSWSPDGQWIAFTTDREGPLSLYLMDAVGRKPRRIVELDSGVTIRWSDDGERLYLFRALGAQQQEISSVRLDGSDLELIQSDDERQAIQRDLDVDLGSISGALSPDGTQTVYVVYRSGSWGVFVANPDRRQARRIADAGRQYSEAPVWSRSGAYIAYIAHLHDQVDLYVVDPHVPTPQPAQLTFDSGIESWVSWRP